MKKLPVLLVAVLLLLKSHVFAQPLTKEQGDLKERYERLAVEKTIKKCVGTNGLYRPYDVLHLSYDDCLSVVLVKAKVQEKKLLTAIEQDLKNCKLETNDFMQEGLKNLHRSNRVWAEFVDDQCDLLRLTFGQGTNGWREAAMCRLEMYHNRYSQLQLIAAQIKGNKEPFFNDGKSQLTCK
jgi:uncharacterized protein YecT (DUF1311 family)